MNVNFHNLNMREKPVLILKSATGTPLGVIEPALDVSVDLKYNEVSSIDFTVPAYVDGAEVPVYEDVIGMRIVELKDIGQFIITNPQEESDGVTLKKKCSAYSLEYEFTFKKISLEDGTYNLFDPTQTSEDILSIIIELMPSWSIGTVDYSLHNKYRTYDINDENLYNLIKGTLQESYGCIFEFDTINRVVNVRDAAKETVAQPVFISNHNLAKKISVKEETEDIITQLDVNGADGVDIRSVNPLGTNKILNLDYFMTPENFSPETILKYDAWSQAFEDSQAPFYSLMLERSSQEMRLATEMSARNALELELEIGLENTLAVTIQSLAEGIEGITQADVDNINADISAKKLEIDEKNTLIEGIEHNIELIDSELINIRDSVSLKNYFLEDELLMIDRYIKEDSISDSTFVTHVSDTYNEDPEGHMLSNNSFSVLGANVELVTSANDKNIYVISGGTVSLTDVGESQTILFAKTIQCVVEETISSGEFVASAYLDSGNYLDNDFSNATISLTGHAVLGENSNSSISLVFSDGYLFFTTQVSEYERQYVSWELYNHGTEILNKLSQPSFTFSVDSANFLSSSDFVKFRDSLKLGQKIYLEVQEDKIIEPIAIGVNFQYESPNKLKLTFSDKYSWSDSSFYMSDLLEKSISMGKKVDLKRFAYASFVDSGASTELKSFMNSALDVSKQSIISSKGQAVSWDGSGIRLRKWLSNENMAYDDRQVWLNNNSIMMTDDNWSTAKLAIGAFKDNNLGNLWGVVAPNIVGTLLAGERLVIESQKKDGETAVFRVDENGCFLKNSYFDIEKDNVKISLDPDIGFAIGNNNLYSIDGNGHRVLSEENAKFWADINGNLNLRGNIYATGGTFSGDLDAVTGSLGNLIVAGTLTLPNAGITNEGTSNSSVRLWAGSTEANKDTAPFRVTQDGALHASKGTFGGTLTGTNLIIANSDLVGGGKASLVFDANYIEGTGSVMTTLTLGMNDGASIIELGEYTYSWMYLSSQSIGLYASAIGSLTGDWTLNGSNIITYSNISGSHTHSASDITSGTLPTSRGGTGRTSISSIRTNLASTSSANALAGDIGVTGVLPRARGGVGSGTNSTARTNLGITTDTSSYVRIGRVAICWGYTTVSTEGTVINLPITYSNARFSVTANPRASSYLTNLTVNPKTTSSFTLTANSAGNCDWIAIGIAPEP